MGFFKKLFGGQGAGNEKNINIEEEYGSMLNIIETLAKVGAKAGEYNDFFMFVCCSGNEVYIEEKVDFGGWLKTWSDCPGTRKATVEMWKITDDELDLFMDNARIDDSNPMHGTGELKATRLLKNAKHSYSFYETISQRLAKIENVTFDTKEESGRYMVFLHDK